MSKHASKSPAQVYEDFLVPGIHARWTPVLLGYADPHPGEAVLDLACGTGIVTRHVAPAVGSDGEVAAVDASEDMLSVARDLPAPDGAEVRWRECDAAALPFEDDRFDLVLCQQAFQFFEDREGAAREMLRTLKPTGRAAVSVWKGLDHHPVYRALIETEARELGVPVSDVGAPFTMGEAEELRAPLKAAGFREVRIHEATHEVEFSEPERFVALTVNAGAAIVPAMQADEAAREELLATVHEEVAPILERYRTGNRVAFPMHANIAVAKT